MKIKNIINSLIITSLMLFAVSCSDVVTYNDGYDDQLTSFGPPTVSKITLASDVKTAIEDAYIADMITIHGDNLAEVESIYINDIEINLSTVYARRTGITLPVPRSLPLEIDNKVKIKTRLGSVSTPLEVTIPDLVMDGFYNEFALDDDTTRIIGDFFDVYDITKELATVKLNGTELPIIESSETFLSIRIPEGTPANSVLTISSPRMESPVDLKFRNMGYPILDMNDLGGTNWAWIDDDNGNKYGYKYVTDGENNGDPETLGGNFFRFHGYKDGAPYGQYDWVNILYARFDMTDADIINNPQNYYMKFEINNNPKTPLKPLIRVGRNSEGGKNYEWDPKIFNGGLSLNTNGQWKTLKFELLDMFRSNDYPAVQNKTNLLLPEDASDRNHFIIVYNPLEAGDADVSLMNFRIVKK
ncbi:MAG: glycan-binding surface protein [Dysgonomonas sp.]